MPNDLDPYIQTSVNWRKTLRQNQRRTYYVIFLFFLIYGSIGILIDLYWYTLSYPDASLSSIANGMLHFSLIPYATIVLLMIALISLWVSYKFYDRLMLLGTNYHEVTSESSNIEERRLYHVVEEMKIAAGLYYMPKVYIIDVDYMNAFASGYSEKSAMLAITKGLMEKLNRDELQAVMAHELSHIRHLDIKLTLTASLLANMTIIVLDLLFYQALFANRSSEKNRGSKNTLFMIIIILRYTLPIVSMILLLYLSRKRELMADAGCVELMRNNGPLASALLKIQGDHFKHQAQYNALYQSTPHENIRREAYIFDPIQAGIESPHAMTELFSTHPNVETRLKAIGFRKKTT